MKNLNFILVSLLLSTFLFNYSCSDDDDDNKPDNDPPPPPVYSNIEDEIFTFINVYRDSLGLNMLTMNEIIHQKAREHSQNMASGKVPYSHEGYNSRITYIRDKVAWGSGAENIHTGAFTARKCVDEWVASSIHRDNIVNDYTLTGVGVSKMDSSDEYYFTQIYFREL